MPTRKMAQELVFSRGGVRHVVKTGETFDFTEEEIQTAEKLTRGIFYPVSREEPPPPAPEPVPVPVAEEPAPAVQEATVQDKPSE